MRTEQSMEHIPLNGLAIVGLTYPSTDKIWLWEYGFATGNSLC